MAAATMSTIPRHNPPGFPFVDDLTLKNKEKWSRDFISTWMGDEISGGPNICSNETPRLQLTQFFDGTVTPFDTSQAGQSIGPWKAFPGKLKNTYNLVGDTARLVADSSKMMQDEYLEWSVERLPDPQKRRDKGPIKRVVFTCEAPEYWNFLAAQQRPTFLQLAQQLNQGVERFDQNSKPLDFFLSDSITSSISIYDPQNPWNNTTKSGTILHLMQPNNTLSAQVDIAAQGTVIRKDTDDVIITDEKKLIKCSGYGDPDRNSDPMIGSMVNEAARSGASISLKDPVGLYMESFAKDEFQLPYDSMKEEYSLVGSAKKAPPDGTFNFQRGDIDQHMGLRLKIQIPDDVMIATDKDGGKRHANVSDLLDSSGQNVKYGSRFAENINMHLYGVVIEGGQATTPINCPCEKSKHGRVNALQVTDSGVAGKETRVKSGVIGRSSFR